jgi:putative ABC transport system ATP-binding protein
MGGTVLLLDDVVKWRRSRGAAFCVRIERLALPRGGAFAATGPSGCGKSTLLDLMALALKPDGCGAFVLSPAGDGRGLDIAQAWARGGDAALGAARRRHIGYVLQTGGLLSFLTVRDNIALPARLNRRPAGQAVAALAERLGIADQLAKRPAELSVGQRQRVAIARALVHRPALVLADEPTASLDPETADVVMELLVEQARAEGATLVVATHDRERAARHGLTPIVFEMTRIDGAPGARVGLPPPPAAALPPVPPPASPEPVLEPPPAPPPSAPPADDAAQPQPRADAAAGPRLAAGGGGA